MSFSSGGIVASIVFFNGVLVSGDVFWAALTSIGVGLAINIIGELIRAFIHRKFPTAPPPPAAPANIVITSESQLLAAINSNIVPALIQLVNDIVNAKAEKDNSPTPPTPPKPPKVL